MSKRNRKKHYAQYQVSQETTHSREAGASSEQNRNAAVYQSHAEEYRNISGDLIKVIIINVLFLAGLLAIYYLNKSQPFLENWYSKIF